MLREKIQIWGDEIHEAGQREGEARILLRQMGRRFGTVTPEVRQRIESGSPEEILGWADRVLIAASVDEVFGE